MPLNVLITAGSRRVALVRAFQRALRQLSPGGIVVVSDVNVMSPAVYAAERSVAVPLSTDPAYLDAIEDICRTNRIGLIVPTIDDELTLFANAVPRFQRMGVRVAVSPPETTSICNDKFATSQWLRERGVDAVEAFLPDEMPADTAFPLFIKPRDGRGGVNAFAIRDARDLAFFRDYVPHPVVQRHLHGREFTIDMLCDFAGRVLSIVPRERVVIRAGVIDRGRTVSDPALTRLALATARALPFVGAVNIQCRIVDRPMIFEINPRFSGGIPLTIASGADFPRMLVELTLGRTVAPAIGKYRPNVWMTNYDSSVFLDESEIGFSADLQARRGKEVA